MLRTNNNKRKTDVSVWILFIAGFLIAAFFLWYFFIYVNGREKQLVRKSFRALTQIGENFKNRYDSFYSVVKSTDMASLLEKTGQDFKQKNKDIIKYSFGIEMSDSTAPENNNYFYMRDDSGKIYKQVKFLQVQKNSPATYKYKTVDFRIKKEDFFRPIEREDVFEELIFVKSLPGSAADEFFYSSFKGELEVVKLDSVTKNHAGISSGSTADIKISGIDYKLFVSKIKLSNNDSYYIGGVISKDEYNREIRSINPFIVLLVVFVFITFLLSIPLFKLKMISENQQLKISDLLLTTLSIIAGTFFIMLVILSLLAYNRTRNKVNSSLEALAENINKSFVDEVSSVDRTLDLFARGSLIKTKQQNGKEKFVDLGNSKYIDLNGGTYNYFKLIFKLDKTGWQSSIISSREKESTPDDYSYRKYFKESGEWRLGSSRLMIDFVISSTSGEQLVVVSKRKGDTIYVVTSRFVSVLNTILPPGYGFCVIDGSGDVKLHSDPERMLRENFLDEIKNTGDLPGAIYGGKKMLFSAKYLGKSHSLYIEPVSHFPLYLITFYDDSYTNSVNLQITSTAFIFLFMMLALFAVLVAGSPLVEYKKSELKRNLDIVEWLRPAHWKMKLYKKIFILNCLEMLLIIYYSYEISAVNVIYLIFLFVAVQITATNFYANFLARERFGKKYLKRQLILALSAVVFIFYLAYKSGTDIYSLLTFTAVLIFINYAVLFNRNPLLNADDFSAGNRFFQRSKLKFHLMLAGAVILLVFYAAVRAGTGFISLAIFTAVLILTGYYALLIFEKYISSNPYNSDNRHFYKYLLSWLFVLVIVPLVIFFVKFYNYEIALDTTYDLYSYAGDEAVRNYDIDKFYSDYVKKSFYIFKEPRKSEGIYYLGNIKRLDDSTDFDTLKESNTETGLDGILFYLKPRTDTLSRERISLMKDYPGDFNRSIVRTNSAVFLKYTVPRIHHSVDKTSEIIYFSGGLSRFGFAKTELFILSVLLLILVGFVIFKLIKFTSNRIFGLNIRQYQTFKDLLIRYSLSGNNLIVPQSRLCEDLIEKYKSRPRYRVMDYKKSYAYQYGEIPEKTERLIIHNIYPDYNSPEVDIEKLQAINKISGKRGVRLLFITKKSMEIIIEAGKAKTSKEKDTDNLQMLKNLTAALENLDRTCIHIYPPLCAIDNTEIKVYLKNRLKDEEISKEVKTLITDELSVLDLPDKTLKSYAEQIIKCAAKNSGADDLTERIILFVQEIAGGYYESIWEQCTNEEKLLLDDIADNHLLNDKNRKVIEMLISKGLLKKNVSIDLMNRSFRNYINIKREEDKEKEYLEVRKTGNWSKYRAPLILILLAIAFFIALQENVLSNIYSILTVILGIVTVVTKISGIFSAGDLIKHSSSEGG